MVKYFLQSIINELINDNRLTDIDGSIKEFNRKVYIEGSEYQEYSFKISMLVDVGDWFKRTIGFTVRINSFSNNVEVERHFNGETITFNRKPAENISNYIAQQTINFQIENKGYKKIINF